MNKFYNKYNPVLEDDSCGYLSRFQKAEELSTQEMLNLIVKPLGYLNVNHYGFQSSSNGKYAYETWGSMFIGELSRLLNASLALHGDHFWNELRILLLNQNTNRRITENLERIGFSLFSKEGVIRVPSDLRMTSSYWVRELDEWRKQPQNLTDQEVLVQVTVFRRKLVELERQKLVYLADSETVFRRLGHVETEISAASVYLQAVMQRKRQIKQANRKNTERATLAEKIDEYLVLPSREEFFRQFGNRLTKTYRQSIIAQSQSLSVERRRELVKMLIESGQRDFVDLAKCIEFSVAA